MIERFGGAVDRTGFYVPISQDPDARAAVVKKLQAA
jgi:hypothetical protein